MKMMKNEQVEGCTEGVRVLQHAGVVLLACVLGAKYVVFQNAAARLALTSP